LPQIDALYRTAIYVLDDESDAQDLVQESFIGAYQSWHEFQYSPDCRFWLFKIMADIIFCKYWISRTLSIAMNIAGEIDGYLHQSLWIIQPSLNYSGQVSILAISEIHVRKAIRDCPKIAG
jgi:RNA polymerase sigma-70 factor (ECF subfamily)